MAELDACYIDESTATPDSDYAEYDEGYDACPVETIKTPPVETERDRAALRATWRRKGNERAA